MSQEPARSRDVAVLGVLGAVVCCGLPVLLAVGGGATLAGIGLRSWLLVLAGAVACVAGLVRWRQRSDRSCDDTTDKPGPIAD